MLTPLMFLALAASAQAELFVTGAWPRAAEGDEPSAQAADLELNSHLLIRDVGYAEEPQPAILFPLSGSLPPGFADFRVLSQSLHAKLLDVFKTRTYLREFFPPEEIYFSVGTPRRVAPTGRVADVEVTFGGEIVVVFGIRRWSGGTALVYPARALPDGGTERLFEVLNPGLRRRVEDAILRRWAASAR